MMLTGKCRAIVIVIALIAVFSLFPLPCFAYTGTVVEVGGAGDLLTVSVDGSVRKIRLYGIACPHFGQPFHEKALFMTKYLTLQKNADISPIFTDNDGIENALVRIEGSAQYINSQLVGYGLAWVKPCEGKSSLCQGWKKLRGFCPVEFYRTLGSTARHCPMGVGKGETKADTGENGVGRKKEIGCDFRLHRPVPAFLHFEARRHCRCEKTALAKCVIA